MMRIHRTVISVRFILLFYLAGLLTHGSCFYLPLPASNETHSGILQTESPFTAPVPSVTDLHRIPYSPSESDLTAPNIDLLCMPEVARQIKFSPW